MAEAKSCHALSSSQMTILPLMPLKASIICLVRSTVVNCAVNYNCLDFQSTAPLKVTYSTVVSWSLLSLSVSLGRNVSTILLQPAWASLILVLSLSVPITGFAVGVEIGDAPLWRCWLALDKRSGRLSLRFQTQVLRTGCMVPDARVIECMRAYARCVCVCIEIGDCSQWRCWLPLDLWSGSIDLCYPFKREGS